ncbi:MAG: hypothetical protein ACD_2C00266G0004 [uncultured bacterium (gcode 4)]|uniref:Uncharacterized protein n=1 Tax=uncultured bacterium (gcode 4) TaxID=1234023 RepID=K2G0Y9_9BACT|nr:MAG: hypothetical protein ACD_2C00266G0004 [uncultured bacterium (gcode 4)]
MTIPNNEDLFPEDERGSRTIAKDSGKVTAETLWLWGLDWSQKNLWWWGRGLRKVSWVTSLEIPVKPQAIRETTWQRVAEIVIRAKSWSERDIANLIKEKTVDFPNHKHWEIVVYADIWDFRQIQELEMQHPGDILQVMKKIKIIADPSSWELMLAIDTGNEDVARFSAYKNPTYSISLVYYDAWFTTTTIAVRHWSQPNGKIFNFNIEITDFIKEEGIIVKRLSCWCRENWQMLNIYRNKSQQSNPNYSDYLKRLDYSTSKDEVFNTFIEMLEYGFFNDDFDLMFSVSEKISS